MPEPLQWDDPSLNWDSGPSITWDGQALTPPTPKMNNRKAIVDYRNYTPTDLGTLAQIVHTNLGANAATFVNPPLTLANFQTQIDDYNAKLQARASGAVSDINAFNTARADMDTSMKKLSNYVNTIAVGDGNIIDLSGFPSYETTHPADPTPPAAPQDVRLTHGELSGTIIARYKPEQTPSTNEIQTNLGDPNNEPTWVQKAIIKGGRAELTGFAPGIVVWVRVRTVGIKGIMGVWSDPAQIRTL
jgi:hypothetical protein